jgi:hypothetical protein
VCRHHNKTPRSCVLVNMTTPWHATRDKHKGDTRLAEAHTRYLDENPSKREQEVEILATALFDACSAMLDGNGSNEALTAFMRMCMAYARNGGVLHYAAVLGTKQEGRTLGELMEECGLSLILDEFSDIETTTEAGVVVSTATS